AETMARIDPSWPCFQCISDEYAAALQDDERHAEALAYLEAQIDRAAQAGVLMEDYEAEASGGASREVDVELMRARVLAALGRFEEAARALPELEAIA